MKGLGLQSAEEDDDEENKDRKTMYDWPKYTKCNLQLKNTDKERAYKLEMQIVEQKKKSK